MAMRSYRFVITELVSRTAVVRATSWAEASALLDNPPHSPPHSGVPAVVEYGDFDEVGVRRVTRAGIEPSTPGD